MKPHLPLSDRIASLARLARSLRLAAEAEALWTARRRTAGLPSFYLFTDEKRLPDPRPLIPHLPPGTGLILRHYGDPRRAALARELGPLCRTHHVALFVAGDASLALRCGAAGLHVPEHAVAKSSLTAWRSARPHGLVTAAAHSGGALLKAAAAGCDGAFLSPVFATQSHPGAAPLGVVRAAALARTAPLPVFALGGIDDKTARRLMGAGFAGFGAIGAFNS